MFDTNDINPDLYNDEEFDMYIYGRVSRAINEKNLYDELLSSEKFITEFQKDENDICKGFIIKYLSQNGIDETKLPEFSCELDLVHEMFRIDNSDILQFLYCLDVNNDSEYLQKHKELYPDIEFNSSLLLDLYKNKRSSSIITNLRDKRDRDITEYRITKRSRT